MNGIDVVAIISKWPLMNSFPQLLPYLADLYLMTNTQTPPHATTVVNPTGAPVTITVANHTERPEKFNGQNFKRWQQKMFFYHTNLGLAQFLKETVPQVEPPAEVCTARPRLPKNYGSLKCKYKTKDGGTKKFVVARFLDYNMVDSKNMISQVQDLQRKDMSVEDFIVRLRIEEDNKLAQKDTYTPDSATANMIEHAGSSLRSNPKGKGKDKRKNDKKSKRKSEYLAPKAGIVKQKFQRTCYNCDQPSHRADNCKMPKWVNPRQANKVNDDVDMIAMVSDVCAMIFEVNLVGTNHGVWWIDTGTTRHVCTDKSMFHSFRALDNGQKLHMGNSATTDIKDEGDVVLKMTSEKELKLTNVLYVLEIRKNLMSGWLLNMFGFRLVFEFDKFVLSKNQIYVGKGYAMNDEAIDKFVLYKTEVENQLGKKIKVVRSDREGEYVSPFVEFCAKHGIRHEFTAPYSPQQNGIAERKNSTLKEMVTAMLISSAKTAVPTPKAQKIGPKYVDCIFIGYAKNSSAYRFIVHESKNSDIQKNTVMELRNASFFEHIFPCLSKETGSSSRLDDEVVQDKRQ
nr:hypothetical protein [Tanacetum cinerariifolium]